MWRFFLVWCWWVLRSTWVNARPPRSRLTLITSIKVIPDEASIVAGSSDVENDHAFEALLSLGENCRNCYRVHVLVDSVNSSSSSGSGDVAATKSLRAAITLAQAIFPSRLNLMRTSPWTPSSSSDHRNATGPRVPSSARPQDEPTRGAAKTSSSFLRRVTAHVVGHQPTYAELFRYASETARFHGHLVALSNADVVLRHTHRLDHAAFEGSSQFEVRPGSRSTALPPLATAAGSHSAQGRTQEEGAGRSFDAQPASPHRAPLALTLSVSLHPELQCAADVGAAAGRYGSGGGEDGSGGGGGGGGSTKSLNVHAKKKPKSGNENDRCASAPAGYSWDVHVFQSPLSENVDFRLLERLEPTPVYPNAQGAESRAGFMLLMAGYELRNPCGDLVAEHWHCSPKTHATPSPQHGKGHALVGGGGGDQVDGDGGGGSQQGREGGTASTTNKARGNGKRKKGRAAMARVDAAFTVVDVEQGLQAPPPASPDSASLSLSAAPISTGMWDEIASRAKRWGVKPQHTTRFVWVEKCSGGRGILPSSSMALTKSSATGNLQEERTR